MLPPLSPKPQPEGTRFSVVSAVQPRLSVHGGDTYTADRDGEAWTAFVPGAGPGTEYTWLVEDAPPLLDPYALAVAGEMPHLRGVVVAPPEPIEWQRPQTPLSDSVIYELHVGGFTRDGSAESRFPGTFRGLLDKIGHIKNLGVTAVELMPVHEFPRSEKGRTNFWGYSPAAWFAPHREYGSIADFREMVRAFHAEGIEVILDVVFNHTAELGPDGPTLHLRALDPESYYLEKDYSGCGNTVRANAPAARAMILDALRWWHGVMGADGFRFDLATILTRDGQGDVMREPPLIKEIEADPALKGAHLIAEAWDIGAYQVDRWPGGPRWSIWNDRFRDDVRRAWLGHPENASTLASRLSGSEDVFSNPRCSLNFVTAHDGFTLRDVVTYSHRHNEANGEGNRDGHSHEVSDNHGVEGPSDDPAVASRRDRARRNLMATLLLSQGVPMLTAGDEFGRTQMGNNNAYCQDNELSWIDWTRLDKERDLVAFVRTLIRLRRTTPDLRRLRFLTDADVRWFAPEGEVDWSSGVFGYEYPDSVTVLVNLSDEEAAFTMDDRWRLVVDTGGSAPRMSPCSLAVYAVRDVE